MYKNNYFPITKKKYLKLNIKFSASFGRELEYYTGMVFKIDVRKGCMYIEIDKHTYYIDNSTNEQIIDKWTTEELSELYKKNVNKLKRGVK